MSKQYESDYFTLYSVIIFFVDGAVSSAIYYKNFLDGSSVRVIIAPYV